MHDDTKNGCVADYPYIDSHLNFSTAATFFCAKGDRCGEVQRQCYSLPVVCVFCNDMVGPVLCDNAESVFFNAIVDNASIKRHIQVITVISLQVF